MIHLLLAAAFAFAPETWERWDRLCEDVPYSEAQMVTNPVLLEEFARPQSFASLAGTARYPEQVNRACENYWAYREWWEWDAGHG